MLSAELIKGIVIWAPAILFAITLHEWAHGYAALRFGDPTPAMMGRLTLNPIAHIDLMWTIVIPLFLLISSLLTTGTPLVFGGAKPVPINPRNFRQESRRAAHFWVAAAGPIMNLLLATLSALLFYAIAWMPDYFKEPLAKMLAASIQMNVLLAVFNMLPVPPLDGGRVAVSLLPASLARPFARIEPFGLLIVLMLLFSGILGKVMWPVMKVLLVFFFGLAHLGSV